MRIYSFFETYRFVLAAFTGNSYFNILVLERDLGVLYQYRKYTSLFKRIKINNCTDTYCNDKKKIRLVPVNEFLFLLKKLDFWIVLLLTEIMS